MCFSVVTKQISSAEAVTLHSSCAQPISSTSHKWKQCTLFEVNSLSLGLNAVSVAACGILAPVYYG